MTVVRLGTAPRAAGLSYAAFQEHWSGQHAGVAAGLPGLRRYVQNHAVLQDGRPLLPYAGFDACSEIEFDSVQAMDAAFASEFYRSDVTADEHSLIDRPRFMLALLERRVLADGPREGVKLLSFWRATARAGTGELAEALSGAWPAPARHEQLLALGGAHDGRPGPVCDAVDVLWFADAPAALAFLDGDAAQEGHWRLAGIGACVGRLIAREITVV